MKKFITKLLKSIFIPRPNKAGISYENSFEVGLYQVENFKAYL